MILLEIWTYGCIIDRYETTNMYDAVKWFRSKYLETYEDGECALYVYKDGVELDLDYENDFEILWRFIK